MNCFVPFYENNDILRAAIDNTDNSFDTKNFKEFLEKMPFLDSHKYALCITLKEGRKKTNVR